MKDEKNIYYKPKPFNEVPPKTIIRHLSNQIQRLEQEKAVLKAKFDCKDKAISEFKKWQAKVAEYKYEYWLSEATKLLDNPPDPRMLKRAKAVITNHLVLDKWVDRFEKAFKATIDADRKLDELVTRLSFEDTAKNLYPPKMVKTPDGEVDLNEEVRNAWLAGVHYGINTTINHNKKD